ncbi:UNKNOWN [Stylonychia lemnae]|uniref:Transmembrane protein n=1 Tax=Stylonychia lemnae TaxID=5949 RepID=A0A078B9C8_STYLE|nr:UNKNOWN [Stylonychia lemnae]|eukprot:CDW91125.1 UNKNOWN [Stylonychia lemnae]
MITSTLDDVNINNKTQTTGEADLKLIDQLIAIGSLLPALDSIDMYPKFNTRRFLLYFLLHVLHNTFGPFFVLVLKLAGYSSLINNLAFWGLNISCFLQMMSFALNAICFSVVFYQGFSNFYISELTFLVLMQTLRNIILGAKYGYFSDERNYLIINSKIGSDIRANQYLTSILNSYNFLQMRSEVTATFYRLNIDKELFILKSNDEEFQQDLVQERFTTSDFFTNIENYNNKIIKSYLEEFQYKKKAQRYQGVSNTYQKYQEKIESIMQRNEHKYDLNGQSLLFEMIYHSKQIPHRYSPFFAISVLRSICPLIARFIDNKTEVMINNPFFWVFFGCQLYLASFSYMFNMSFLNYSYFHIRQKNFMMEMISTIIDKKNKLYYQFGGYFPSINPYNPINLYNWLNLRSCVLDFGLQFDLRIQLYSLIIIPVFSFLFASYILTVLMNVQLPLFDTLAYLTMPLDFIVVFIILTRTLKEGAALNGQNMKHKNILISLKEELVLVRTFIKQEDDKIEQFSVCQKLNHQSHILTQIQSPTQRIKRICTNNLDKNKLFEKIDLVENMINTVIERLDFQYQHQPIKFLTITLSEEKFTKFLTVIATVSLAVVQSLFSYNKTN